ncbi:hypothetical protein V3I25_09755 [Neisseria meningitidis]|nr:hypothetical protein [Neisseria meningitidis]
MRARIRSRAQTLHRSRRTRTQQSPNQSGQHVLLRTGYDRRLQ